jgi:hypothetical protein
VHLLPHLPLVVHTPVYRTHSEMRQRFDDGGVRAGASAFLEGLYGVRRERPRKWVAESPESAL